MYYVLYFTHWTLNFIEKSVYDPPLLGYARTFESTCAPPVASRFLLCIQYVIAKFIYLPFAIDLIRRDHGISGP